MNTQYFKGKLTAVLSADVAENRKMVKE